MSSYELVKNILKEAPQYFDVKSLLSALLKRLLGLLNH
jgi:hypothetical protein